MPEEFLPGCQRPPMTAQKAAAPEASAAAAAPAPSTAPAPAPAPTPLPPPHNACAGLARVGAPAPWFTASAYLGGKFVETSLSEYTGKWVLLCFYPGDFTFV